MKLRMPARVLIEWLVLTAVLLALATALSWDRRDSASGQLTRIDTALYDFAIGLAPIDADPALVLVEIDEASLAQIGRWPWPRAIHAALLEYLSRMGARAIALDLLLVESGSDDQILADSMKRSVPIALPVSGHEEADGFAWPLYPAYETGARARLGHAHFRVDADGFVRGLSLEEAGRPAFAIAILNAAGRPIVAERARAAVARADSARRDQALATGRWPTSVFTLLPRVTPVGDRISYAALMRGEIDPARIRDRVVLVGATARGLGDSYANAVIDANPLAAGVQLHAATFSAIASDRLIGRLGFGWHAVIAAAVLLATMGLLYRVRPRYGLPVVLLASAAVVALSVKLLQTGFWMPPGGTLVAVLLAYPLWSWRRLEAAVRGLVAAARDLDAEPDLVTVRTDSYVPAEPVARELASLSNAAERVKTLRRLLSTVLDRLPHPAIVADAGGAVLLLNRVARTAFAASPQESHDLRPWLVEAFGDRISLGTLFTSGQTSLHGVEASDAAGNDWLIDADRVDDPSLPRLWLLQFADISPIRKVQREREQMMRFVSHDLRAPQISILSAIDQLPDGADRPAWADIIERHARRSLELAESFVQWARAENKPIEREPIDLIGVLAEAIDATWPLAVQARVRVQCDAPETAPAHGDAQLIRRAVINLIDNAIKYGPEESEVDVSLAGDDSSVWEIRVADHGPGLSETDRSRLFEPYFRGERPARRSGTGLGLAFVRMVAERHGGKVRAENRAAGGTEFVLTLPAKL